MAGAVSENNMADQFNATQAGTMSPEDYAQQQLINRQQRFADMLMQQNQQPQGQMISGRYVAPSFFQMLNPVANMLAGAYVGKQSDTEAAKLAEKIRSGRATAEEKITNLALGTPEVPAQPAVIPKGQTLRDDNGMLTYGAQQGVAGKPATAPDLAAALREINNPYNYGAGKDLKPLIYKQLMPDPTELERNYKFAQTPAGGNFKGDFNAYKNQMNDYQKIEAQNAAARLNLERNRAAYEGIPTGGGGAPVVNQPTQPVVNQPTGGSPVMRGNAPQVSIAPNAPAYAQNSLTMTTGAGNVPVVPTINMAGMSPKQQQELRNAQAQETQANVKNAYEVYKVAGQIESLLPQAHGSGVGAGMGYLANLFDFESPQNVVDEKLKVLGSRILMQVPRFQGPQSDKDVAVYKEAAGSLSDPNKSIASRMGALQTIKDMNSKYAPELDWSYGKDKQAPTANVAPPVAAKSSAPAGVDQAVWNVMTPQEQSLWQKR
jgi:hypothetical protein